MNSAAGSPLLPLLMLLVTAASLAGGSAEAQQAGPDSARTEGDSGVVRLPPVRIVGSISPAAGPGVGGAVPARVSVIAGSEMKAWQPRTLADALSMQPGISFHDDLGSGHKLNLTSRGFTAGPTVGLPSGLTVFLDGVRQNEPGAQEVNFDLLPLQHVERVEVLDGSSSLLGPNSLAGAVNLVTRRGYGASRAEVELATGSFGAVSGEAAFAATAAGLAGYAGGGYSRESGWRDATGAWRHNVFVNLARERDTHALQLQLHLARSRAETAGSLPESMYRTPRVNFTAGDYEDLDVQQLAVSGGRSLAGGAASFRAYVRRSAAERFNVNQPPDEDVRGLMLNRSAGAAVDWLWSRSFNRGLLAVRTGLDGAGHRVHGRIHLERGDEPGADSLTTDVHSPGWDVAGFFTADFLVGRVTLSGGGRYDHVRIPYRNALDPSEDTTSTFTRFNPRFGMSAEIAAGTLLYVSVAQSFRAPAILELGCADPDAACPLPFALGDDPPLAPVRVTTYEAGVRSNHGPLELYASAFRADVTDEIFFVLSEAARLGGYFTNVPKTRRTGAELAARVRAADDALVMHGSYTRTLATFRTSAGIFSLRADDDFSDSPLAGANDVQAGDRLPLTPEHQAKLALRATLPAAVELGADVRYTGRQWLRGDEANETWPLKPYLLTSARIGFRGPRWSTALVVTNVFDTRRASFGTFNENRESGELERFLTPVEARSVRLILRRSFRAAARDPF